MEIDWTVKDGRANTSDEFHRICREVEQLIRNDAQFLIAGRADATAKLIMAQLAHKYHYGPQESAE